MLVYMVYSCLSNWKYSSVWFLSEPIVFKFLTQDVDFTQEMPEFFSSQGLWPWVGQVTVFNNTGIILSHLIGSSYFPDFTVHIVGMKNQGHCQKVISFTVV